MAREIPEVVRAAAGLAATVVDEARKLPETLPGLPVRVIGMAMQHAMKVQQQYAGLVARGDELFTGIRGEAEPGLATFDDDDGDAAPATGYRESAFDRADVVPDEVPDRVGAQDLNDTAAAEAPANEEILEELAIDEAIENAPTLEETAPAATEDGDAVGSALAESGDTLELPVAGAADAEAAAVPSTVDVLTPEGDDVETAEATVTDEGVATPVSGDVTEAADAAGPGIDVARGDVPVAAAAGVPADADGDTAIAAGASVEGDPAGADAAEETPAQPPVDGYDAFTIAQLRGRLRGYTLGTVTDLLAYEEATRAREPYLRMLRNRMEKLEEKAIESSPLAPRGT
ncbi:lipid droplet-associated protein [Blastococcus sp. CCUG 61487]|uniref:lipid droplet-associated protein n=1 Tax=Blastococcus sp. CCUG 61487 TaxID=1840703 RepID=UPI0010BFECE1|nr:lipid droplet-associated protein [Blastococcus sp. CCUG 61487]TKJ21508.1 hypothetical protein A6V29_07420 [Blastococcus sp. CCUG 61487]